MANAVYSNMAPAAQDALQPLLVKAAYWAQSAAETTGGPFTSGMYSNMSPFAQDSLHDLAAKLAYWLQQIAPGGGGAGGLAFSTGAGSPEGVVVGSPGDSYWDTTNDFEYRKVTCIATNTGWKVH